MAVVKKKPTSPGRRFVVQVVNHDLHKGAPHRPLLEKQGKSGGRNNVGRVTTRHQGGGHRQHYRLIDFKRNKDGIPAVVERLNSEVAKVLAVKEFEERLIQDGIAVGGGSPADLLNMIRREIEMWRKLVTAAGIKVN